MEERKIYSPKEEDSGPLPAIMLAMLLACLAALAVIAFFAGSLN